MAGEDRKEQDLLSQPYSSIDVTNDFIRAVDKNGVSYKNNMADVAKTFVEGYAGSSLGGSEKSVKQAIDTLQTTLNGLLSGVLDAVYPVGSIYMSVNSTSPEELFGGTWAQIQDKFLLAAGTHAAGSTGGAEEVTLTKEQSGLPAHAHGMTQPKIPNHSHSMKNIWSDSAGSGEAYMFSTRKPMTRYTEWDGGGGSCYGGAVQENSGADAESAHNNMPPYLTVYVWKRTA